MERLENVPELLKEAEEQQPDKKFHTQAMYSRSHKHRKSQSLCIFIIIVLLTTVYMYNIYTPTPSTGMAARDVVNATRTIGFWRLHHPLLNWVVLELLCSGSCHLWTCQVGNFYVIIDPANWTSRSLVIPGPASTCHHPLAIAVAGVVMWLQ